MNEVFEIALLSAYLKTIQKFTSRSLDKALNGTITDDESKAVAELSQTCNVITAIYFYRKNSNINEVLRLMPLNKRRVLETSLKITWNHLERMSPDEITDLAIETIHKSTELEMRLYQ